MHMLALALATVGCQGAQSDGLSRVPVRGHVTLDGKPLDEGLITFVPKGFEGPPVGGPITDGAYSIPRERGPIAGVHTVSVYSRKPTGKKIPDPEDPSVTSDELYETIPAKYNDKSGLTADVKASGNNTFDFELAGRIKTPPRTTRR